MLLKHQDSDERVRVHLHLCVQAPDEDELALLVQQDTKH